VTRRQNSLEDWEVSLIKAMLQSGNYRHDQDILAYFTRPSRSVNHARISEIRDAMSGESMSGAARKFVDQPVASDEEVGKFIDSYPNIDPETGLHLDSEELLVKAREAMLFAVQAFNNPTSYFKSEIFIVASCIAWTYLLHHYYRTASVDYIYRKPDGQPNKTPRGAVRHYDLQKCLNIPDCPLDKITVLNLEFILAIRNEIEHQKTSRIDDTISAKLQACVLNFNHHLTALFGHRYGLDRELSMALQFSGINPSQKNELVHFGDLPAHIQSFNRVFEEGLSDEEFNDPRYAYRVALVQKTVANRKKADQVIEFVKAGSEDEKNINRILLKDREKPKFRPKDILAKAHELGFGGFKMLHHSRLWKEKDAKSPKKGFGVEISGQWYWYEQWLDEVIRHCQENEANYRGATGD
jgi:hypothetical protein